MNAKQWHVSLLVVVFSCLTALLMGSARAERALDDETTMLSILEGSGSMWGQIDDQDKITIAKDVMTDLIRKLPETVDEDLLASGHRRKGDGNDIERRVPAGEEDTASMIGVVQGISPRGKTPITRSLEMVAERLRALQEGKVVLVSGGEPAPEAAKATQRTIAIAAPGTIVAPRLQHDPIQVKNAASGTRIVTLHPRQARAPVPAGSYAVELNGSLMTIEVAAGETLELPEPAVIKITHFDAPGAGGSLVKVKNVDSGLGTIMSRRRPSAEFWPGSYVIELNGSMMTIEVAAGETVELPEPAVIKIINFDAHGAGGSQVKIKNVDSGLGTVMSRRKPSAAFWPGTYQVEPASGGVHTVSVAAGEELTVDLAGTQ